MLLVFLNGCPHIRGQEKFVKFSRTNLRLALNMEPWMLPHLSKRELLTMVDVKGDVGRMARETVERYHARHELSIPSR